MISLGRGLGLIASSAGANSAFAVPLKLRRRYEWENTWALCHLFAMIILPMLMAAFVLPTWRSAVGAASYSTIAIVMAFGFLWGTGSVAFAIGIDAVGVSLGYALIMGTVTAVGPTVPMLRRWPQIPVQVRVIVGDERGNCDRQAGGDQRGTQRSGLPGFQHDPRCEQRTTERHRIHRTEPGARRTRQQDLAVSCRESFQPSHSEIPKGHR